MCFPLHPASDCRQRKGKPFIPQTKACPIIKLNPSRPRSSRCIKPSSTSTPPSATRPSRAQRTTSPPPNYPRCTSRVSHTKRPPHRYLARPVSQSPTMTTTTRKATPARPSPTPPRLRPRTQTRAPTPQATTRAQHPPTPPARPLLARLLHLPLSAPTSSNPPHFASARKPSTSLPLPPDTDLARNSPSSHLSPHTPRTITTRTSSPSPPCCRRTSTPSTLYSTTPARRRRMAVVAVRTLMAAAGTETGTRGTRNGELGSRG